MGGGPGLLTLSHFPSHSLTLSLSHSLTLTLPCRWVEELSYSPSRDTCTLLLAAFGPEALRGVLGRTGCLAVASVVSELLERPWLCSPDETSRWLQAAEASQQLGSALPDTEGFEIKFTEALAEVIAAQALADTCADEAVGSRAGVKEGGGSSSLKEGGGSSSPLPEGSGSRKEEEGGAHGNSGLLEEGSSSSSSVSFEEGGSSVKKDEGVVSGQKDCVLLWLLETVTPAGDMAAVVSAAVVRLGRHWSRPLALAAITTLTQLPAEDRCVRGWGLGFCWGRGGGREGSRG